MKMIFKDNRNEYLDLQLTSLIVDDMMFLSFERKYEHARFFALDFTSVGTESPDIKPNSLPCKTIERDASSELMFDPSTRYATCESLSLAATASTDIEKIFATSENIKIVR